MLVQKITGSKGTYFTDKGVEPRLLNQPASQFRRTVRFDDTPPDEVKRIRDFIADFMRRADSFTFDDPSGNPLVDKMKVPVLHLLSRYLLDCHSLDPDSST